MLKRIAVQLGTIEWKRVGSHGVWEFSGTLTRRRKPFQPMKPKYHKDDDGFATRAGDVVFFTYGIPPVRVLAEVVDRDGVLWVLTPGHRPSECRLRDLRRFVGGWYRWGRLGFDIHQPLIQG